jgi:hypothetical protein
MFVQRILNSLALFALLACWVARQAPAASILLDPPGGWNGLFISGTTSRRLRALLCLAVMGPACVADAVAAPTTRSIAAVNVLAGSQSGRTDNGTEALPTASSAEATISRFQSGGQAVASAAFYSAFGALRANLAVDLITAGVWANGSAYGGVDYFFPSPFNGSLWGGFTSDSISIGGVPPGGASVRVNYAVRGGVSETGDLGAQLNWVAAMRVGAYGSGIDYPPGSELRFMTGISGTIPGNFIASQTFDLLVAQDTTLNLDASLGARLSYAQNSAGVNGSYSAGLDAMNTGVLWLEPLTPGLTLTSASGHDYLVPVPEPSTYVMALAGLACGGFSMWRRHQETARTSTIPRTMITRRETRVWARVCG